MRSLFLLFTITFVSLAFASTSSAYTVPSDFPVTTYTFQDLPAPPASTADVAPSTFPVQSCADGSCAPSTGRRVSGRPVRRLIQWRPFSRVRGRCGGRLFGRCR